MDELEDVKVISCNKHKPKSDFLCKNINPEGILSNNCRFVNMGEVMHLYNKDGGYIKTLYFNSELKKYIMNQYNNFAKK